MSAKWLRRVAAVLLLAAGVMVVWNVTNSYGTACGSWVSPNTAWAGQADAKRNSGNAQTELENVFLEDAAGQDRVSRSYGSPTAQVDSCAQARSARTPVIVAAAVAGFAVLGFSAARR